MEQYIEWTKLLEEHFSNKVAKPPYFGGHTLSNLNPSVIYDFASHESSARNFQDTEQVTTNADVVLWKF